ncbi:MAG: hypothetical protein R3C19_12065 [Planctomycetaceae bacterium]
MAAEQNSDHLSSNSAPRGRLWTLAAGIAVFAAILASVWFYLWPRLSGEPPSRNADLRLAAASPAAVDGWERMVNGKDDFYVDPQPVLTAADVATFRISYDGTVPVLGLNLRKNGAKKLREFAGEHVDEHVALVINGSLVSCPVLQNDSGGRVDFPLGEQSRDDVQEILARLTQ